MSAISFLTLQQELAAELRMNLSDSEHATLIKRWLNLADDEIHSRYDWSWKFDREIVQTIADKTAGTVAISASGQTVTGTSTAFVSADVGKFIQFSSSNDWYKVTAVASATELTIEKPYVGSSALSAGTYKLRQVFYSLSSSVEKVLSARQTVTPAKLELVHYRAFDRLRPDQTSSGNPLVYVIWGYDSSNNWTFTLDPSPDSVMNVEVRFKKKRTDMSADADNPSTPEQWKNVLLDFGLVRGYEYVKPGINDPSDKRSEQALARAERGVERMVADAEPEGDWAPQIRNPDLPIGVANVLGLPGKYER